MNRRERRAAAKTARGTSISFGSCACCGGPADGLIEFRPHDPGPTLIYALCDACHALAVASGSANLRAVEGAMRAAADTADACAFVAGCTAPGGIA